MINKNTLYDLFITQNKLVREIADQYKVSNTTISRYLRKHNIYKQDPKKHIPSKEELYQDRIINRMKIADICKKYDFGRSFIDKLIYEYDLPKIKIMQKWESKDWTGYGKISGSFWGLFLRRTKKRSKKLEIEITIEDVWNLYENQNGKCALSKLDMNLGRREKTTFLHDISIDRIDSNLGYTLNNVCLLHKDINVMKQDYSLDYFLELCEKVSNPIKIENKITSLEHDFRFKGYENISGRLWGSIESAARKRNLDFSISIQNIWKIYESQNGLCNLSGLPIIFVIISKNKKDQTASLDRIDSSKGYIEGNVQWVHKDINRMKWNLPQDKFIEYCKLITENNK